MTTTEKIRKHPPLIGFAAWSGTGKTTLLEKIIPLFRKKGLRVGVIKHAHHDFDIDHKGKDSYRLRKAGAIDTIVASGKRWAHIHEIERHEDHETNANSQLEPNLRELLSALTTDLDIILIEGFKHESIPRIELSRSELNLNQLSKPLLYPDDKEIIAIATDSNNKMPHPIKTLDINNPMEIVAFIQHYFSIKIPTHLS